MLNSIKNYSKKDGGREDGGEGKISGKVSQRRGRSLAMEKGLQQNRIFLYVNFK